MSNSQRLPMPENGPWKVSDDITILPPNSDDGIELFTTIGSFCNKINQTNNDINPLKYGLFSYDELKKRGKIHNSNAENVKRAKWNIIDPNHNKYIYFQVPQRVWIENPVQEHFNESILTPITSTDSCSDEIIMTIKVDPENTYVYNADIRASWIEEWDGQYNNNKYMKHYTEENKFKQKIVELTTGASEATINKINEITKELVDEGGKLIKQQYSPVEILGHRMALYESRTKLSDMIAAKTFAGDQQFREVIAKIPNIPIEWIYNKYNAKPKPEPKSKKIIPGRAPAKVKLTTTRKLRLPSPKPRSLSPKPRSPSPVRTQTEIENELENLRAQFTALLAGRRTRATVEKLEKIKSEFNKLKEKRTSGAPIENLQLDGGSKTRRNKKRKY